MTDQLRMNELTRRTGTTECTIRWHGTDWSDLGKEDRNKLRDLLDQVCDLLNLVT